MKFRLVVLLLATTVTARMGPAQAADAEPQTDRPTAACIDRKVTFDGIQLLHFFEVTGDHNSKLHLHQQYPVNCSTRQSGTCESSGYLIPGDAVAVGKRCGMWSYVQYIGNEHVSIGWVESARLVAISSTDPPAVQPFRFKLTKGQSRPVCEAYLERLNGTNYGESNPEPPFCDRPEYGSEGIPGFTRLNRIMLDRQQVESLFPTVLNFWYPKRGPEADGMRARRRGDPQEIIDPVYAWRYDPPVDIDNDGTPDNVLMWRGDGIGTGACNHFRLETWTQRPDQVSLLMLADDTSIDVDRTTALLKSDVPGSAQAETRFRTIGRSIGVFQYQGVYYMDAFSAPSGNYIGEPLKNPKEANVLNVFLRKKQKTLKLCEYVMSGHDYPPDNE